MKTIKFLMLSIFALSGTAFISAQTAEEIIGKHIDALGGKDQLSQITSVYMEGTLDVMGNMGSVKITTLHGKGYKQEIDVAGTQVTMCYTDSMGWQINPMTGNYGSQVMSAAQYNAGRAQIYIGGPFIDYATKGYTVELTGQEPVGDLKAFVLRVTSADNPGGAFYYIDPNTWYLIKTFQQTEMMNQLMDIVAVMSNYQMTDNGYAVPYRLETNYGGQFYLIATITKVEINKPIDLAVFAKP